MLLKQYYLGCLAHASYLIVDPTSATAVVIDPQRDIDHICKMPPNTDATSAMFS